MFGSMEITDPWTSIDRNCNTQVQMEGALAPHDAKAVLGGPMGDAMGALREGRAIIQVTNH